MSAPALPLDCTRSSGIWPWPRTPDISSRRLTTDDSGVPRGRAAHRQTAVGAARPPASGRVGLPPGAPVPPPAIPHEVATAAVRALAAEGHRVAVTGSPNERSLTAAVAGRHGLDLGGCTDLRELAALLRGTAVVVCGNTGVAHLAAAVSTPVVSFFAPAMRWDQWG